MDAIIPRTEPKPNYNPAERLQFGKEERQKEQDDIFFEKGNVVANDMQSATTWCRWPGSNRHDVAIGGF